MGEMKFMRVLLNEDTHYGLHSTGTHVQAIIHVVSVHYDTPACSQSCLLCFMHVHKQAFCFKPDKPSDT